MVYLIHIFERPFLRLILWFAFIPLSYTLHTFLYANTAAQNSKNPTYALEAVFSFTALIAIKTTTLPISISNSPPTNAAKKNAAVEGKYAHSDSNS